MKRVNKKKQKDSLVLVSLLLIITIGYAILRGGFSIHGLSILNNSVWDIHFENAVKTNNSTIDPVVAPSAPASSKLKTISYDVNFTTPGEVYEFNVDIVNAGTINAIIEDINSTYTIGNANPTVIEDDGSNLPNYLIYYVKNSDNTDIVKNHILKKETSETIVVHIEFKKDINKDDLQEASEKVLHLDLEIDYKQAPKETDEDDTLNFDSNPGYYDGELVTGATFVDGQYTYTYLADSNYDFKDYTYIDEIEDDDESTATPSVPSTGGWHVKLTNRYSTDPITDTIYTNINGKPIISMANTYCGSQATSVDLSSVYTANVIDMRGMFDSSSFQTLDVSGFDTSNVISFAQMFDRSTVSNLIGLTNFDTSSAINMGAMFQCTELTVIDVTSFDTSNVIDFAGMFVGDTVTTIYASDSFVFTSNDTFNINHPNGIPIIQCENLIGGLGTSYRYVYDKAPYDYYFDQFNFASIDSRTNQGLFTSKNVPDNSNVNVFGKNTQNELVYLTTGVSTSSGSVASPQQVCINYQKENRNNQPMCFASNDFSNTYNNLNNLFSNCASESNLIRCEAGNESTGQYFCSAESSGFVFCFYKNTSQNIYDYCGVGSNNVLECGIRRGDD